MTKILLVEDNEMNKDMLLRRLTRRGYDVICAGDGSQAIDMADAELPDLILMDLSLPIMDGWEASKRIKSNVKLQHIPIIALTAHAMSGDREKSLAAGCNDYVSKPIEIEVLLKKIEDLTSSS